MSDKRIVPKDSLFDSKSDDGQGPVPGACYKVFLAAKIPGETVGAQDFPDSVDTFLGKLIVCDHYLVIQYISIRQAHPIQGKGQKWYDQRFFPSLAPESRSEVKSSITGRF